MYSGPEYRIYYQYSAILNVIFVTFMYGISLPLLFPIALGFFILFYIFEKITITYAYRKPPMYDDKIHQKALFLMQWAPFVMMIFTFWILGNNQLFKDVVNPITYKLEPIKTDHSVENTFVDFSFNFSYPPLFFSILIFIGIVFGNYIISLIELICKV